MAVFGLGGKQAKEQKTKNFAQLCEAKNVLRAEYENMELLMEVFGFPGWDDFREKYLQKIRLPKLYAAAAKQLGADEATRNRLAGQIAEAEFLSMSKNQVKSGLERLTLRLKDVESRLMREDSQKQGSAEQ